MLEVGSIDSSGTQQRRRFEAELTFPDRTNTLWFDVDADEPAMPGDAFASALLMPAMRTGHTLKLKDPISPELRAELEGFIQDVYLCWDPTLNRVEIDAPTPSNSQSGRSASSETSGRPVRAGVFFSGGVDSFFSVLRHESEIDSLVTVHGFDIKLTEEARWEHTVKRLSEVAAALGKRLRTVQTNAHDVAKQFVPWGLYHGGALASVGHLLSGNLSRMYIGSTHTYADLFPWGSHPLLDPHWSSAHTSFVHDGGEATRIQKVERVAQSPIALSHLRVCWQNVGDRYNCGQCEKCIRTMVNLAVVGKLESCPVFPEGLDLKQVSTSELLNENDISFARENVDFARKNGSDPALIAALEASIKNAGRKRISTHLKAIPYKIVPYPVRQRLKRIVQSAR